MVTFGSKAFRSVHIDATKKVYTSIFGIGCLKRRSADQKKKRNVAVVSITLGPTWNQPVTHKKDHLPDYISCYMLAPAARK
jgi:hypothetical protein